MKRWALILLAMASSAQARQIDEKEFLAVAPVVQPAKKPNPFDQFDPKPERLGPGPHTLLISSSKGMTRIDYKSGPLCQKARDSVREQDINQPSKGAFRVSALTAVCVPR